MAEAKLCCGLVAAYGCLFDASDGRFDPGNHGFCRSPFHGKSLAKIRAKQKIGGRSYEHLLHNLAPQFASNWRLNLTGLALSLKEAPNRIVPFFPISELFA